MRTVVLALLLLATAAVSAEEAVDLNEIEQVDTSVFGESAAKPANSLTAAEAALAREEDKETVAERGVEDAIAESAAETGGEDATLYSFRAMSEATTLAGTSVTEKADETHDVSARFLASEDNADRMFAEINREQQILMAKKALVSRQKLSIADSEESLHKLENLIDENKSILRKNQRALRRASNDLIKLIAKYQIKLRAGLSSGSHIDSFDHLLHVSTEDEDEEDDEESHDESAVKTLPHQKAAVATPKTAAASKALAQQKADSKKKLTLKSTAPVPSKKMTFSQLHHESDSTDAAEAEESTEEESEEADESEEEESESEEGSDESEEEESDESENEEEADDSEESDESESDEEESDEEEEEESSDSFVERDSRVDRDSVLAGLPPPPQWETTA